MQCRCAVEDISVLHSNYSQVTTVTTNGGCEECFLIFRIEDCRMLTVSNNWLSLATLSLDRRHDYAVNCFAGYFLFQFVLHNLTSAVIVSILLKCTLAAIR